jgi:hypothetical protein
LGNDPLDEEFEFKWGLSPGPGWLMVPPRGRRILHDPNTVLLCQSIGNLHPRAARRASFRAELHLRLSLIPLYRDAHDIHFHCVQIQGLQGIEVLIDS